MLLSASAAHAAAPEIYYTYFYPSNPRTSTEVNFGFYAGGDAVKGAWDFAGGDAFALTAEGFQAKHTFATDGLHSITLAAENAAAERGVGRLQMATHPDNWAPYVQVNDKDGVVTGQPTSISFYDSDDSPPAGITYSYDLDNDGAFDDGVIDDPDHPWSARHTFTTDGAHPVKVKVDDGQGQSTVAAGTITTHTANQAPTVDISAPRNGEMLVGEALFLDLYYGDDYTDDNDASIVWTIDGVEQSPTEEHAYGIGVGPWDSVGEHVVKVRATDTGRQPGGENPLSSEATYVVKVVSALTPPPADEDEVGVHSLTGVHSATPSFRTFENVGLSAYAPSLGAGTTYAWDLDNDGQFDDATGYSAYFAAPNKGSYKVSVQATADGKAPVVLSRTVVIDQGTDYAPVVTPPSNTGTGGGGNGGGTAPPALTPEQQKAAMVAFLSKETVEFLQAVAGANKKGIDAAKAILVLGTLGPDQLPNGGTGKFDVFDKAPKLARTAAAKKPKLLGTTKVTLAKGESKKVQVKLNKKGKALLKKKGKVKLTVQATLTDALTGAQAKQAKSYTFKVKKKKARR